MKKFQYKEIHGASGRRFWRVFEMNGAIYFELRAPGFKPFSPHKTRAQSLNGGVKALKAYLSKGEIL